MKNIYLIITLFTFSLTAQNDITVNQWIQSLRDKGLALTNDELEILHSYPDSLKNRKQEIAKKYQQIIAEIKSKRTKLADQYRQNPILQDTILNQAQDILISSIEKLLIPLWMGGKWDFYGVPRQNPNLNKPVACGHFVQKILTDAGFNIKKRGSTWLAYLGPKDYINSFTEKEFTDYKNWNILLNKMKEGGQGLYLIGLECYWGHILFGKYEGGENLLLMHAGPHPKGASVNYDNGKYYLTEFENWKHIWIKRFNLELVKKWLLKEIIRPCVEM